MKEQPTAEQEVERLTSALHEATRREATLTAELAALEASDRKDLDDALAERDRLRAAVYEFTDWAPRGLPQPVHPAVAKLIALRATVMVRLSGAAVETPAPLVPQRCQDDRHPQALIKSVTTDAGMVYACEKCSHHWFRKYGVEEFRHSENGT